MALHPNSVEEGDAIMYVARDGKLRLAICVGHDRHGAVEFTGPPTMRNTLSYADMGIIWMKGREVSDARALLAAYALSQNLPDG
ncbi:MAG: hypothetical protein JO277_09920 [Candidatus Eremiobacteraeota bacterium]|nr:hypothetical protein [Candidatus Eremiobacteraeota bacterium]